MKRYLLFFLSLWRPNNRISGNQVFRNNTWKPGNVFGNPDISGQTQIPENQENLKTRRLNLKKKTYYMELDHLVTILNLLCKPGNYTKPEDHIKPGNLIKTGNHIKPGNLIKPGNFIKLGNYIKPGNYI